MAAKADKPYTLRLLRDIREFYKENSQNMFIVADEEDITSIHALIIGPEKTPYQYGFFYFFLKFTADYPLKPPQVTLMTTGGKTVRFNPNLYTCGRVCLSILGTWPGPSWSAAQTLFSLLLSIQSLMNEKPYHNEPGYEVTPNKLKHKFHKMSQHMSESYVSQAVHDYNELITHETLRVAVLGMLDDKSLDSVNMPEVLKSIMISLFKKNYQFYEQLISSKMTLDGKQIIDPFRDHNRPPTFGYKKLLETLLLLKDKYQICCRPPSVAITGCASTAESETKDSDSEANDVLSEAYTQMAAQIMAQTVSQPQTKPDNEDNWDDLIDSMNEDLNEDTLDSYSSDEEPLEPIDTIDTMD